MNPNYNRILAVAESATQEEIKKAYRQAAMRSQPIRLSASATSVRLAAFGYSIRVASLAGLLAALSPSCLAESGVFIFNETFSHPASSAKAVRYVSAQSKPPTNVFTLANGQQMTIVPSQPLVILPDISIQTRTVVGPDDAAGYIQSLNDYKAAFNKYPLVRPLLKQQVADLEDIVTKLRSGQTWFEGKWLESEKVAQTQAGRVEEERQETRKREKAGQLASIDKKIQALQGDLDSLRAKVEEASGRNEKATTDCRKAADKTSEAIKDLLKQPTP